MSRSSNPSGPAASAPEGSGSVYPTSFGRGWMPVERDIGLPRDVLSEAGRARPGVAGDGGALSGSPERDALGSPRVPLDHSADGPPPGAGEEPGAARTHHNGWTAGRKAAFLHMLAESGNVRVAASRVALSHQSAYLARRRDPVFAAAWAAALVLAREAAEQVLASRAIDGVEEDVWCRGERVGTRVRYDSRLLLAHLGRLDKRAEESEAGAYAERFDELVARVAGEAPGKDFAAFTGGWDEPEPLLPLTRVAYADRRSVHIAEEAQARFRADLRAGKATRDEAPSERHSAWFEEACAEWDAWHARACATVDAAVSTHVGPPVEFVEIDYEALEAEMPRRRSDEPNRCEFSRYAARDARYDDADEEDDDDRTPPDWRSIGAMEYKSLELGLGPASARSSPARGGGARAARDGGVSPPGAGRGREGYTPPPPAAVPLPLQGRIVASSGHRQLRQPGVGWVMKKPPLGVPSEGLSVP